MDQNKDLKIQNEIVAKSTIMESNEKSEKKNYKLKNLQNLISLFYLLLVGIGMVFEYCKYRLFHINIFEYADIFDFLIAPFREPMIFLFVFASILFLYVYYVFENWFRGRFARLYSITIFKLDKKPWYESFRRIILILFCLLYVVKSALILGDINKSKIDKKENKIEIVFADNEIMTGSEIGKTDEVIFLKVRNQIHVIPYKSLVKKLKIE